MFDHNHYVPILKNKKGEFKALEMLNEDSKTRISPFFKVVEIERDRDTKLPKKTPQKHLRDVSSGIIKSIHGHIAVFVDLNDIEAVSYGKVEYKDVIEFFEKIKDAGINVIPVRGVHVLEPYEKVIKKVCENIKTGLCLRLDLTDIDDYENLDEYIEDILERNKINAKDCDIVIDLEKFKADFKNIDWSITRINDFPHITSWRTFTIAVSSFPEKIKEGTTSCDRDDIKFWKNIIEKKAKLERLPSYGDYGIQEPGWNASSVSYQGAVNLRYALTDKWLLFKGRKQKKGDGQFKKICQELIKNDGYGGTNFCWADRHIMDCTMGQTGPGNGTTWRQVGFNRHMALTVKQLR